MAQDSKKQLSSVSSLLIAILSLGLFAGGTAIMVKAGVVSSAPFAFVLGEDDEDDGKDDDDEKDEDEDKDDEDDNKDEDEDKDDDGKDEGDDRDDESEKLSGRGGDDSDEDNKDDGKEDEDGVEEESENEDEEGDDRLKDLMEKVAESEKEIAEKQQEGVDAAAALSRIALAKGVLEAYKAAVAAGNFEEADRLAREIKKLSHFAVEEDLHDSKKAGERLRQAQEKIVKAKAKLALLAAIGGSTASLSTLLAEAEAKLASGNAALSSGDFMGAENLFKEAKNVASKVKDAAENALYALGGSDDEFDDDYEDFSEEVSDDLDEIAGIEGDDKRVKKIKEIAMRQKQAGLETATAVQLAQQRSALARFFLGADDDSLTSISAKIAENTKNALALRALAASSTDADLQVLLIQQAERIEAENMKLQGFVAAQADSNGLFGWLVDLFR